MIQSWRNILSMTIVAVGLICAQTESAVARNWKPSPEENAREYLQIKHYISPTDVVVVQWIAPEGLDAPAPDYMRKILSDYLVIVIARITSSEIGQMISKSPGEVRIKDSTGATHKPLAADTLPYNVTFVLNGLRQVFSQLGVVGHAMNFYVFEPRGIESCKDGQFWVIYGDEEYDYKTPIPGCR